MVINRFMHFLLGLSLTLLLLPRAVQADDIDIYLNPTAAAGVPHVLSLIHISEPTRLDARSRMPSSA